MDAENQLISVPKLFILYVQYFSNWIISLCILYHVCFVKCLVRSRSSTSSQDKYRISFNKRLSPNKRPSGVSDKLNVINTPIFWKKNNWISCNIVYISLPYSGKLPILTLGTRKWSKMMDEIDLANLEVIDRYSHITAWFLSFPFFWGGVKNLLLNIY